MPHRQRPSTPPEQGDLRDQCLQLRIELFFLRFSLVLHSNSPVIETFFLRSGFFASHDQQHDASHERNSTHDRR
jgi:hypothetical protein